MVSVSFGAASVMLMTLAALTVPVLLVWLVVKILQGAGFLVKTLFRVVAHGGTRIGRFVRGEVVDSLHAVGGIVTACVILPLTAANLVIGRWSASSHYGRALKDEVKSAALCVYRCAIGHPIRLVGLGALTEGIERRLPDLVSRAPQHPATSTKKNKSASFDGYKVVGTLTAGGSGARLFLARPRESKVREYRERGQHDPGQVVIKSFRLEDGSTLPQIVRESRALEAARRLGLVLEHELDEKSFHYVMPYVPGEDLDVVIRRFHARTNDPGLDALSTSKVIGYASDLMETLERFHRGGLWHKDIKPSNLIVSGDRVHVVDLGLVTALESPLTLTTHGTEYFRDPELVRLALKGVKVQEVDGVKFDLYSAGAVLYSMIENSFPAHGSLSRITKPCPEGLQWIIRRSMADLNVRYTSAREMWADLQTLIAAKDPWSVLPADLPSVSGADAPTLNIDDDFVQPLRPAFAGEDALAAFENGVPLTTDAPPVPANRYRHRNTVRRRVIGAMGVVGMAGLVMGGVAVLASDGSRAGSGTVYFSRGPGNSPIVVRRGTGHPGREDGAYAHESRAADRRHASPRPRMPHDAPMLVASAHKDPEHIEAENTWSLLLDPVLPASSAPEAVEAGSSGTVLILADTGLSTASSAIEGLNSLLIGRGYAVLGVGAGDGNVERDIDLTAGARHAIGLAGPEDDDALERLQHYLDGTEGLDSVVWVAPGSSERSVRVHALLRSELQDQEPAELRFAESVR